MSVSSLAEELESAYAAELGATLQPPTLSTKSSSDDDLASELESAYASELEASMRSPSSDAQDSAEPQWNMSLNDYEEQSRDARIRSGEEVAYAPNPNAWARNLPVVGGAIGKIQDVKRGTDEYLTAYHERGQDINRMVNRYKELYGKDYPLENLSKEDLATLRTYQWNQETGPAQAFLGGIKNAIPGSGLVETSSERRVRDENPTSAMVGGMVGNVAGAMTGAPIVAKGASNIPGIGKAMANSPLARTAIPRVLTGMGLSAGQSIGRKDFADSFWDTVQAGGGAAVSVIPEVVLPPGAAQLIGQPLVDLAYDYTIAKVRGDDTHSAEWWRNEALSLAVSAGFAIKDVVSGETFKVEQAKQRGEIGRTLGVKNKGKTGNGVRGKIRSWVYGKSGGQFEIVDPNTLTTRNEVRFDAYDAPTGERPRWDETNAEQNASIGKQRGNFYEDPAVIAKREAMSKEQDAGLERLRELVQTSRPELTAEQISSLKAMVLAGPPKTMSPAEAKRLPTGIAERERAIPKTRENTPRNAPETKVDEVPTPREERAPDEAGRVQEADEKRARFDALPTLDVSTAEVKSIGRGEGFRQRVIGWLAQKDVFGEYRNKDKGWDVTFNNRGARNVMGHTAHDGKVALLEYAPDLIENGIYLETIPKRAGLDSHIFAAKATIDGEPSTIGIVVRDDGNGKRYYDHAIRVESGDRAEPSLRVQEATAGNPPDDPNTISNIVQRHLNRKGMAAVGDKIAEIESVSKSAPAPSTVKVKEPVENGRLGNKLKEIDARSTSADTPSHPRIVDNGKTGGSDPAARAQKSLGHNVQNDWATTPDNNKIPNSGPEVNKKIKNLSEPPKPEPDAVPRDLSAEEQAARDAADEAEKESTLKVSTRRGFSSNKEARAASERAAPGDLEDIGTRKGQKGHYHQFQFGDRIFGLQKDAADATVGRVYEQDAAGRGVPLSKEKVTLEEAREIIAKRLRDTPEQTHKFSHNPPSNYSSVDPQSFGKADRSGSEDYAIGTFDIELSSGTDYGFPTKSGLPKIQMPEMVKIAKEVLDGKLPTVKRFLRKHASGLVFRDKGGEAHMQLQKDIFKKPELAARVLGHEIGHADHAVVGGELGEIISNMKSSMADEFTAGHGSTLKLDLKQVRDELWALSQKWRPLSDNPSKSETRYRRSPEELYSDAISALLNDPDLLKAEAPTAFEAISGWIKNKTAFAEAYNKMMEKYSKGEDALIDSNIKESEEGYQRKADERKAEKDAREEEKHKGAGEIVKDVGHGAIKAFVDKYRDIHNAEERLIKAGIINDGDHLGYFKLRSIVHVGGQQEAYTFDMERGLVKALHGDKGEITPKDITDVGLYMEYNRIAHGDRQDIANPKGITKERAEKALNRLKQRWGDERFEAVVKAADAVADVRAKHIIPALEHSGLLSPALLKKLKENRHYATFNVVKDFYDKYGDGIMEGIVGLKAQTGTFRDVGNPLQETFLNDLKLLQMAARNDAIRTAVNNLYGGEDITGIAVKESKLDSDGNIKHLPSTNRDMQTVVFFEDGEMVGYDVSKGIAKVLTENPHAGGTGLAVLRQIAAYQRPLLTTLNPKFHVRNPIRDFKETHLNLRGNVLYKIGKILEAGKEVWGAKTGEEMSADLQALLMNRGALSGVSVKDESALGYDKAFEDRLKQFGTNDPARDMWIKRYGRKVAGVFDAWLSFEERTMKLAGYKIIKEKYPELSDAERMHLVRTMSGTSDIASGGTLTPWTNNLFLYSNSTMQGWYGSVEAFKRDPKSYLLKQLIYNVIPKAVCVLAGRHYISQWLDDSGAPEWAVEKYYALEASLNAIPDYYKARYDAVPLFVRTEDGRQYFIPFPKSFEEQYIGESFYYALDGLVNSDKDATSVMNILSKSSGAALAANPASGGLTPVLKSLRGAEQYVFENTNPYDAFYGRQVIPKNQYRKDVWKDLYTLGKWSYKNVGGELFFILPKETDIPDSKKADIQKAYGIPLVGNPLSAMLRVSDDKVDPKTFREWQEVDRKKKAVKKELEDRKKANKNK
jgi:hypothetical protein